MNRRTFFASLGAAAVAAPVAGLTAPPPPLHLSNVTIHGPLTIKGVGPVSIVNCEFHTGQHEGSALTFTNTTKQSV